MNPIEDLVYVRLSAPDLDLMLEFLRDFGMVEAHREDQKLFMRGVGSNPMVHVTELGKPHVIGYAFKVQSMADLEEAASIYGKSVERRTEFGGGHVVRLNDPDGNLVELVYGLDQADPIPCRQPNAFNPAVDRSRENGVVRLHEGPSHVVRLGHVAVHTASFQAMADFYMGFLGMRISDTFNEGDPNEPVAAFLHCGLGKRFVDHHTLALIGDGRVGFDHMAFEVIDFDDLMMGNRHLINIGRWKQSWGVGRHVLGSQIFDYWRDPFGSKIEHWTDGDSVNDDYKVTSVKFDPAEAEILLSQWGPPLSDDFIH